MKYIIGVIGDLSIMSRGSVIALPLFITAGLRIWFFIDVLWLKNNKPLKHKSPIRLSQAHNCEALHVSVKACEGPILPAVFFLGA
jgi:hypothetical protein